jgi:hypothetical protein
MISNVFDFYVFYNIYIIYIYYIFYILYISIYYIILYIYIRQHQESGFVEQLQRNDQQVNCPPY